MRTDFTNTPEDIYINTAEAAREFGYTSDHVTRLARTRKISAYREGRRWWVNRDSLKLFTLMVEQEENLRLKRISENNKREIVKKKYIKEKPLTNASLEVLLIGPRLRAFWVAGAVCSALLFVSILGVNFGYYFLLNSGQSAAVKVYDGSSDVVFATSTNSF